MTTPTAPNLANVQGRRVQRRPLDEQINLRGALLHPAFVGGLLLLALNDHVLKQSGLLPGVITGKLSDFAGLFVAPLLLATICRVRSRRSFAAAHLVVGAVFAALQLSSGFAQAWARLFDLLGAGWVTTMDPSDLLACFALVASYRFWTARAVAAQEQCDHLPTAWRRGATVALAFSGVMVSAATSTGVNLEGPGELESQTYIHNESEVDLVVSVRPLRASIHLDCPAVALNPGGLLPESAFRSAESQLLLPRAVISPWSAPEERECYASWISGETFPPFIMFWDGALEHRILATTLAEGSSYPELGVSLVSDPDGTVVEVRDTSIELAYVPAAEPGQAGEGCELVDPDTRLDWDHIPNGDYEITKADLGPDGCFTFGVLVGNDSYDGYICMPPEAFPFAVGDQVNIDGDDASLVLRDQQGAPADIRYLRLDKGVQTPMSEFFEMAARDQLSCGFSVDLDCPEAARPADLLVVGEVTSATIEPDSGVHLLELPDGRFAQMQLVYGSFRAVMDADCSVGGDSTGADMDLVTLIDG